MLSREKAMTSTRRKSIPELFNEQDLLLFDRETREFLDAPAEVQYMVEPRIAGVEVVMIYEKGALRSASTRNGPVTMCIKTILTVPLTFVPLRKEIRVPDYLEIRADVYMDTEALVQLNQERTAKHLPSFSNLRAAVEDSLSQTDPRITAKRPLNYFISGTEQKTAFRAATRYELMVALQELGLRVNRPHIQIGNGIGEVIDSCRRLSAEKGNFPYPVEGALVRVNSLDLQGRVAGISGQWRGGVVYRFCREGLWTTSE
jgi:DNA ligase (NAD+)